MWNKWKADWNKTKALEISWKKRLARMGGNEKCSRHTGVQLQPLSTQFVLRLKTKGSRLAMSCLSSHIGEKTRHLSMKNLQTFMRHSRLRSSNSLSYRTSLSLSPMTMLFFWRLSVAQTSMTTFMDWDHNVHILSTKNQDPVHQVPRCHNKYLSA